MSENNPPPAALPPATTRQPWHNEGMDKEEREAVLLSILGYLEEKKDQKGSLGNSERLMHLRHASRCKLISCPTNYCLKMKAVLAHIHTCHTPNCTFNHCQSSKALLSHMTACKKKGQVMQCAVCAPVMRHMAEQDKYDARMQMQAAQQAAQHQQQGGGGYPKQQQQQAQHNQFAQAPLSKNPTQHAIDVMTQKYEESKNKYLHEQKNAFNSRMAQMKQSIEFHEAQLISKNNECAEYEKRMKGKPSGEQKEKLKGMKQTLKELNAKIVTEKEAHQSRISKWNRDVQAQVDQLMLKRDEQIKLMRTDPRYAQQMYQQLLGAPHPDTLGGGVKRGATDNGGYQNKRSRTGAPGVVPQGYQAANAKGPYVPINGDYNANGPQERRPPAQEGDSSLMKSFTVAEIEAHLESLNESLHLTSTKIGEKCRSMINKLLNDQYADPFAQPVNPVALNLPDYFEVVKEPMDLGTVKKKVDKGCYTDVESFEKDVRLTFTNCILYNGERSDVGSMAKTMIQVFQKDMKSTMKPEKAERTSHMRNTGETCILCGVARRLFEPIMLYCNGICGMQRIRKNAAYYTDVKREYHWCQNCYTQIPEQEKIPLSDGVNIRKKQLQKLKNDAINEEGWVCCDKCDGWVHQVCALFNGRKNKNSVSYICPKCHLDDRKAKGSMKPTMEVKKAVDLPKSKLSEALEDGVKNQLDQIYNNMAKNDEVDVDFIPKALPFHIRVVSNIEKKHQVRKEMAERFTDTDFPSEFPVRTKCVLLFQTVDGSDVLVFGMYLYEYGHDCPPPNRRRVYISYLDSVQFFKPRQYRTAVFQSIIVEYLRFVKERGFHTAHIWSCPPSKGDDYIFYAHPETQRTPRVERLCEWYMTILEKARQEGVVLQVNNLYEEYFTNPRNDPRVLPYFEGDYWTGEVEKIIETVKAGENRNKDAQGLFKPDCTQEELLKKRGTRSNPTEIVDNIIPDKVMTKIGASILPMKPNFLVAYLYSREFAKAKDNDKPFSVAEEKKAIEVLAEEWAVKEAKEKEEELANGGGEEEKPKPNNPIGKKKENKSQTKKIKNEENDSELIEKRKLTARAAKTNKPKPTKKAPTSVSLLQTKEEDSDEQSTSPLGVKIEDLKSLNLKDGEDETVDEDPIVESDIFANRQEFLNYCTKNNTQFDEMRRAKHTTMMVLFQLHNPSAARYMPQCGSCYNEINHGIMHKCTNCADYCLCQMCYQPVITGLWAQRDPRFSHDSNHRFKKIDIENQEKQLAERKKMMVAHLRLMEHSVSCPGAPNCTVGGGSANSIKNCTKMKQMLAHYETCPQRTNKTCEKCTKLNFIVDLHAQSCHNKECKVPFCSLAKEKYEKVRLQQQQMEDRRREAQNEHYGN
ncbi:hypothetical protein TrLO_g15972 [Triparma laevis f. longispina]|uniref:histone acetyltransferase n=1 Tax=Triparma laevis f. longispina TaxID=1714387 RepID=A0A9W7CH09_9STRA|nr:hypothetical protein TrLO_g15972 [Triparma laevis f. longispina]